MKPKIAHSSWIVTLPLVAAAVAYMLLFYLPGNRAIGKLQDQIKTKQDYIVGAESLVTALRIVRQKHKEAQANNAAWQENAPVQGELSSLYGKISELAKAAGTTTTRFDPQPPVLYDTIRQIPLVVGCTGSFSQIYEFLRGLESLPAEIWASKLRLDRTEGSAGTTGCELNLAIFTNNSDNSDYVKRSE